MYGRYGSYYLAHDHQRRCDDSAPSDTPSGDRYARRISGAYAAIFLRLAIVVWLAGAIACAVYYACL
jgi:hypothetical protein